jgi:hypothetical protein
MGNSFRQCGSKVVFAWPLPAALAIGGAASLVVGPGLLVLVNADAFYCYVNNTMTSRVGQVGPELYYGSVKVSQWAYHSANLR